MADPVFLFSRAELIVLLGLAMGIGILYGLIQKKRGKFDEPTTDE